MEFRILGPLQVTDGDRLIDLGSRKQRAVLAMLLIDVNRVVSLDRLIDQLWGEEPPPRATASLQAYISNLRRAIEPNRGPRTRPEVLRTQPPGYLLRLEPVDLDVARFQDAVASGHRLLSGGDPAGARDALVGGLELFRGEPLAEFGFEPFAAVEIARLEELRLGAVEGRIQADLLLGRHAEVVAELERLVAAHPLREGLWGSLMKALYRCGRQAEALRAFEDARRTLVDQLGVRPGPELRRLEADILAQAPELDWHTPDRRLAAAANASPRAPAQVTDDLTDGGAPTTARRPMVGRAGPLARLEAICAGGGHGQGRVALLSGEPGIGKSRLAEEFSARCAAGGWAVAWGKCYGGGTPAFSPWAQVIRALRSGPHRDVACEALRPVAAQLAQIAPDLAEAGDAHPPPAPEDPESARFRLYEAVESFMTGMARNVPVLVVLDDLHWADPPSLQLLGFLAGALKNSRTVVVGTYRPGEVEANEALAEALAVLAREDVVERFGLSGLDLDGVGAFMAGTLPAPPAAELIAAVHRRTDGNPFFVSELIRLLQSERRLENADAVLESAVPDGVRDVIRRRLARLPEQTNSLLLIAAVAGREFDLDVVQSASGLDIDRTIELLEAALINGVVEEDRDTPGRFRFAHALVQEVVYGQLTVVRGARLHARVGLALERLYGDQQSDRLAELAHHFNHAVSVGEGERAFHYTMAAADDAQRRLAHDQAETGLRRCLALVQRLATMPHRDERELDVQLRLSLLLTMTRGYAAADVAEASERARELCQRLGDRQQMVPTLLRLWAFACVRADFSAADRIAAELLAAADGDPRFLIGGHWATGVSAWHQGRLREAEEHLGQAHALGASAAGESLSEVYTHHPSVVPAAFLAAVQWLLGERDAALATAEKAESTARQLGQPFSTVPALFFRSMVAAFEGDAVTAGHAAAEAWDLSSAGGFRLYMAMSRIMRGWATSQQAEAASGAGDIEQGLAEMEATGACMLRHFFLALLADAYAAAGRVSDALGAVDAALAASEASGERFYLAELHRLRAVLLSCITPPRADEAAEELHRAAVIAEAQDAVGVLRNVRKAPAADLGAAPVPAREPAQPGVSHRRPPGDRAETAEETLAAARRSLTEGDVPAAVALLDRGMHPSADPELRLLRGQLAVYEAEWAVGRGHLEEAVRIFQDAGLARRAALAASWVARVYVEGLDSPIAARAWSARATRLLQGEGHCREAGWVAVNVLGCLVADPDELERRARLALEVARQFGDVDLEGKALADAGLAMVSTGRVRQGLEWLDEAMAMVTAGQVDIGIGAQMTCSFLTACERSGDLDRACAWLDILDARSGPLATHCRLVCGALLCAAGRWDEGEAMLRETLQSGDLARPYQRVTARAALAELRIRQGDLDEAERLLRGLDEHAEAAGPLAHLHLARREFELAMSAARRGLRLLGTDRLRAAPLWAAVAEAELGLGHVGAAQEAAARALDLAEKVEVPSVGAVVALATARVLAATGPAEAAAGVLHEALRRLGPHEQPTTRIALHLELARIYADADHEAALAQARAALELGDGREITFDREASALLCRLGLGAPAIVPTGVHT